MNLSKKINLSVLKQFMNLLKFFLCTFFLILADYFAINAQNLSLQECISTGLANNYNILVAKNLEEIAQKNVSLGNAGFLPNITLNAAKIKSSNNSELVFFNGTKREAKGAKSESFSGGATLNWVIFDGLGMFIDYQRLKNLSEIEKIKLKETIYQTIVEIKLSYYSVASHKKTLNTIKSNILLYEEIIKLIETKLKLGTVSKYDLMQAQVELNNQKSIFMNQLSLLKNSKSKLNAHIANDTDNDFDISDSIIIDKKINKEDINLTRNFAIATAEKSKYLGYLQSKSSQSLYFPTISFNTNYNYLNAKNEIGQLLSIQTGGITYGVSASWNIFNGFTQRTSHQNNKILAINSDYSYKKIVLDNKIKLNQAYQNYEAAWEIHQLEKENISIAQQLSTLAIERYKMGTISNFELQEAQKSYIAAATRAEQAKFNLKSTELELEKLSGSATELK